MINFIYGTYGSGKTTKILDMLKKDAENGVRSFLIVPDQEALQFERLTLSVLPTSSQLNLEVLGFSRLYNRVCREYGGISYSYITKSMRSLLMWKTLNELDGQFEDIGKNSSKGAADISLTDLMLNTVGEFKMNAVTPTDIERAAKKLPDDSSLRKRLRDLALLYASFDNYVSEKYSDSADDLSRLRDVLKNNDFFKGTNVYIDSFTSFTAVQHQIIEIIFKDAANVTLTIPLSSPQSNDISSKGIQLSNKKLLDSAKEYNIISLNFNKRALTPALSFVSKNLWEMNLSKSDAPQVCGDIIIEKCDTPYAEAEAIAAHILELLRSGARCRDISIIARDCEKYRGILDTALEKSNIPFYFSQKSELCSTPSVKFILTALRIKKYNWQKNDVISHIKTGLCDIDPTDANMFEEYVNTWNIHGDQFLQEIWAMNPDGFVSRLSERGQEILAAANKVRKKLTEPLMKLFVRLDAAENIADMCRVLFAFIQEVSLKQKLATLAHKAAQRGDLKQAEEFSRIYEIMLQSLANIAEALGDEMVDTEEFTLILKNTFDNTDVGTIPTSIDEVTVGSAHTLRASRTKYAFVIGLCEGEFPASVTEKGFFSSLDKEALCSLGIELAGNDEIYSSNELMYIQRAFAVPSNRLYLFTHTSELGGTVRYPSLAYTRVKELFSESLKEHEYKLSDLDYIVPAPKNALGILRSLEESEKKASLCEALGDYISDIKILSSAKANADTCKVSIEAVESAFDGTMTLSATSFEKYVKCPFNYFCSNILGLREKKDSSFKTNDMGLFVHYVLEMLIKNAIPENPDTPAPDDDTLIAMTEKTVEAYIRRICPPTLIDSKRLRHLYARLKDLSLLLVKNTVKEFSSSDFRPVFYELAINDDKGGISPLVFKLEDGTNVSFKGVIDRVDLYKFNEKVYVRIVDYKTGQKTFSLEDLDIGINTQMLIYLFTLCRNGENDFKRAIGLAENEDTLPAGVVYLSSYIPTIEATDYDSENDILLQAEDSLSRSGLFLNDEDVLRAMNHELDSRFIANINSTRKEKGRELVDKDGFKDIFNKLQNVIIKIATELHSGKADANPLIRDKKSPCDYCSSKPICRKNK